MYFYIKKYCIPLVLALALHGLVAFTPFIFGFDFVTENDTKLHPNKILSATLVTFDPPNQNVSQKPLTKYNSTLTIPSAQEIADAENQKIDSQPPPAEVRDVVNRKAKRQLTLEDLRNQVFNSSISNEAQQIEETHLSEAGSQYIDAIYSKIVRHWARPPSATKSMQVVLHVELFPNGKLNTVSLIESSGNAAFDRSTIAAVKKVEVFDVPSDPTLFESRFRQFNLKFKPEDLLR